jgi:DNA-binding XRE family transcriptional regulator
MGKQSSLKTYRSPSRPVFERLPDGLLRRKPRSFAEWSALRRWRKLPSWEIVPAGYLLRSAREKSGMTQQDVAEKLGCTQQAVAQAERWESNPSVEFLRKWAAACGARLRLELTVSQSDPSLRSG